MAIHAEIRNKFKVRRIFPFWKDIRFFFFTKDSLEIVYNITINCSISFSLFETTFESINVTTLCIKMRRHFTVNNSLQILCP